MNPEHSIKILIILFLINIQLNVCFRRVSIKLPAFYQRLKNYQYVSLKASEEPTTNELENIKLDETKLSAEDRKRLEFIKKLTTEADEFARASGMLNDKDDDEVYDKGILETNWSGQSDVEETSKSRNNFRDLINRKGLAIGDAIVLVIFSAIGRTNHGEELDIIGLLKTAAPFVISWLTLSPFLGAFSREATSSKLSIPVRIIPPWFVSISVALTVRGILKEAFPPTPFIIVSMTATYVLLVIWREIYISAVGSTSDDEYKSAGFLEVFKMIGSLIKRW